MSRHYGAYCFRATSQEYLNKLRDFYRTWRKANPSPVRSLSNYGNPTISCEPRMTAERRSAPPYFERYVASPALIPHESLEFRHCRYRLP